jgi:hypothetical protein
MGTEPTEDAMKIEDTVMEEKKEISPEEKLTTERQEWVKQMRLKFCVRPEFEVTKNMIFEDGTLNQE